MNSLFMMKKITFFLFALVLLLFASCVPDTPSFSDEDLVGKWCSGTEYYRFDGHSTNYQLFDNSYVQVNGATWDTGDDVREEEAQPFVWTLEGDNLQMVHQMFMGGKVPKAYTVTTLTHTTLSLKDNYNRTFTYTRVN